MNTTERILSLGSRHPYTYFDDVNPSCRHHWKEMERHNPFCAQHWNACITNNPGGFVPDYNPTEWDDLMNRLAAEQFMEFSDWR
jgi:hypothetical protein